MQFYSYNCIDPRYLENSPRFVAGSPDMARGAVAGSSEEGGETIRVAHSPRAWRKR